VVVAEGRVGARKFSGEREMAALKPELNKMWAVVSMEEGPSKEVKRKDVLKEVATAVSKSTAASDELKTKAEAIVAAKTFTKLEFDKFLGDIKDFISPPDGGRRRSKKSRKSKRTSRMTRRRKGGEMSEADKGLLMGSVQGKLKVSPGSAPSSPVPPGWMVTRVPKPKDTRTMLSPPANWDGTLPDGVTKDSDGTYSMARTKTTTTKLAGRRSKRYTRRR